MSYLLTLFVLIPLAQGLGPDALLASSGEIIELEEADRLPAWMLQNSDFPAWPGGFSGQQGTGGSSNFAARLAADFRRLSRWDSLLILSCASAASYGLSRYDPEPTTAKITSGRPFFDPADHFHGAATPLALSAGLLLSGYIGNNSRLLGAGDSMLRAQIVAGVVTYALKFSVRRQRPDGGDRRSFPSGHAMSTFAMAAVLDREFGRAAGIIGYGLAAYISAARVDENEHYWSDVLFSAVVGTMIGYHTSRYSEAGPADRSLQIRMAPMPGGAAFFCNIDF